MNHVFLDSLRRTSAPSGGLFQLSNILTSFPGSSTASWGNAQTQNSQMLQDDSYLASAKEVLLENGRKRGRIHYDLRQLGSSVPNPRHLRCPLGQPAQRCRELVSDGAVCGTSGPLYYLRWTLWCPLVGPFFRDSSTSWEFPEWPSGWESAHRAADPGLILHLTENCRSRGGTQHTTI